MVSTQLMWVLNLWTRSYLNLNLNKFLLKDKHLRFWRFFKPYFNLDTFIVQHARITRVFKSLSSKILSPWTLSVNIRKSCSKWGQLSATAAIVKFVTVGHSLITKVFKPGLFLITAMRSSSLNYKPWIILIFTLQD